MIWKKGSVADVKFTMTDDIRHSHFMDSNIHSKKNFFVCYSKYRNYFIIQLLSLHSDISYNFSVLSNHFLFQSFSNKLGTKIVSFLENVFYFVILNFFGGCILKYFSIFCVIFSFFLTFRLSEFLTFFIFLLLIFKTFKILIVFFYFFFFIFLNSWTFDF